MLTRVLAATNHLAFHPALTAFLALQSFLEHVGELSDERLRELCQQLNLVPSADLEAKDPLNPGVRVTSTAFLSRETLLAILADRYQRRFSQLDSINEMPLFPTEQMLWDENIVPTQLYVDGSLALPKLHLQVGRRWHCFLRPTCLLPMLSTPLAIESAFPHRFSPILCITHPSPLP